MVALVLASVGALVLSPRSLPRGASRLRSVATEVVVETKPSDYVITVPPSVY